MTHTLIAVLITGETVTFKSTANIDEVIELWLHGIGCSEGQHPMRLTKLDDSFLVCLPEVIIAIGTKPETVQ